MSQLLELTDDTFEDELERDSRSLLVDFWAEWCGPCKLIAPILEEIEEEYSDRLRIAKVNVDECQNVPLKYGVRTMPTLLLFTNGEVVKSVIQAKSKSSLVSELGIDELEPSTVPSASDLDEVNQALDGDI